MEAERIRYRAEVEEPAFAMLRDRKASRPPTMRKEPTTSAYGIGRIDPRFPPLTGASAVVNSLTIGMSWPPDDHLRSYPSAGFISSCHDCFLVLYFGAYRPGIPSSPGCYLVLNTWANSVAIVPPLHTSFVTDRSHSGIGTGVAVLRHNDYFDYVLVELFRRQDSRTHLGSNKATLFLWWSPGSGPLADGQWMQKEVLLPLPADDKEDDATPPTYSFRADMVFAVSTTSLCWVDLRTGILLCDHIDMLATDDDTSLVFRFIPLPEECAMKPDPLSWGRPAEEFRTMRCMNSETIIFVSMDGFIQGHPIGNTLLTTWTLKFPLTDHWMWEKHPTPSLCVGDLLDDLPIILKKDDDKSKQLLIASRPVLSVDKGHLVTHLTITEFEWKHEQGQWEATGLYELSIDMHAGTVLELSSLGTQFFRHSQIFTADISCGLKQTMVWERLQRGRSTLQWPSKEEMVVDGDEYEWVFPKELDKYLPIPAMSIF